MKIKALARELGTSPRELIKFLRDLNVRVKSDSDKLNPRIVRQVKDLFSDNLSNKQEDEVQIIDKSLTLESQNIVIKDLAEQLEINVTDIMRAVLESGLMLTLNSEIDQKTAIEITKKCNINLTINEETVEEKQDIKEKLNQIEEAEIEQGVDSLIERPPVITIMGHVDHGKTRLLDTIRKTNVIDGEAGGITQHIGAYQITFNDKLLTFLDTPGHAAFTSLRSRGAQVTDIVILVVAADEGIKPQTVEAIHHAKAAKVPIIVAINKMDKPEADPDRVKQQLSEHELLAEDWGGDTVMVPISAKKGEGINDILEMILLSSELLELKAQGNGAAKGIIIESKLSKTKGPIATALIKSGHLKVGDLVVVGTASGKVKALHDDLGNDQKDALPGTPVEILGISEVPIPGEILEVVANEKVSRDIVAERKLVQKQTQQKNINAVSLERLSDQIESGDVKTLNLIVKADVNGSLEAILHSINQIPNDEVSINVIHSAPGNITENDVLLAAASSAIIIGFQVDASPVVQKVATDKEVDIKSYSIIYEIIEDITKALKGLFKPVYEEENLGHVEVRQIFKFSKIGKIAGSYVKEGIIKRNALARIFRGRDQLFEGKINSLKRFEDDVKEVAKGYECGIVIDGFDDLKEGDAIQCYHMVLKKD